MIQEDTYVLSQESCSLEHVSMTLDEFLVNDVEGHEYVKGQLVAISPASRKHGRISINIIRYLDPQVYENKLGNCIQQKHHLRLENVC